MALPNGARLGPYEVIALLGRGGMGEVYRAVDTRVGRTVAIKVLAADGAERPGRRQRFEREARAIARLNHPHICTLYDVGEDGGTEFLVMEYLEGETLATRLAREPMPLRESLRHGVALAGALARAHREGIIHRDLKPSNVMLTESGVKLLDFGLAKLRDRTLLESPPNDETTIDGLSPEGTLIGTIAYMSPEQLAGRTVDARTDIYALGLILYEMITGRRAFTHASQASLIAAIMTEDPPPIAALRPDTPASVERIVATALAKDPDKRWQDAADLSRELEWAAGGPHTVDPPPPSGRRRLATAAAALILATVGASAWLWRQAPDNGTARRSGVTAAHVEPRNLVILPCRGSGDAVAEAYCNGLTDTLSAKMTPLASRRGIQITSTLEARRRNVVDAAQARRELGATIVLDGSIVRAGDMLRINYVFVDAATLRQIDGFSTTAAAGDPFDLQDRVATWAESALALRLDPAEREALRASGTRAPGALDLYLEARGRLLEYQHPENVDAAIDLLDRAIALDARFAAAYAARGQALWQKFEASHQARHADDARASCAQAATLDGELPASHVCLGTIALGTGAYDVAAGEFQRAVDREPTSDEATLGLARAQARQGANAEAEATYRRAIALRPQYWATHVWLGTFYREHARYADAVREYEIAAALTPDNARVYATLGGLYGSIGRYDEAIAACRKSVALDPSVAAYSNWASTLSKLRRFDEAIEQFAAARRVGPDGYIVVGGMARASYLAGKRDQANALYAQAIALASQDLSVNPADIEARISLAAFYAKTGEKAKARDEMNRLPPDVADPHVLAFGAVVWMDVGDRAAALDWLARAISHGLTPAEIHDWVELDSVRNDLRLPTSEK